MMETRPVWNLLLVDDDEDDYIILKNMFQDIERINCQVAWTADPKQGLALLHSRKWDAVLVDYDLGLTNGLDFIREAIQEGFKEPLIIVTGRGSYELDLEATGAGATDYISKYVLNPILLERVVRHAIERHDTEARLQAMVDERTEELQNAMEELHVMNEELRVQNEEILVAQEKSSFEFEIYRERQRTFPIAYIVTDPEGRITKCDYGTSLLFGAPPDRLVGRLLSTFISMEDVSQFDRSLVHLTLSEPVHLWKFHLNQNGSTPLDCYFTVRRLDNSTGGTELRWLIQSIPLTAESR